MKNPEEYTLKVPIKAIQWAGNNLLAIRKLVKPFVVDKMVYDNSLLFEDTEIGESAGQAFLGDWVFKQRDELNIISDKDFKEMYIPFR